GAAAQDRARRHPGRSRTRDRARAGEGAGRPVSDVRRVRQGADRGEHGTSLAHHRPAAAPALEPALVDHRRRGDRAGRPGGTAGDRRRRRRWADSVIREAARLLRARLGDEVQLRELQAETKSPAAWALVERANDVRRRGERALSGGDAAAALVMSRQADSLLDDAEQADPAWSEAAVLHGYVSLLASRAVTERTERANWLRDGLVHAARALHINASDAAALG